MKKQMLLLSAASLMAAGVSAQQLRGPESETDTRECYVTWPASNALDKYVKNWTPGQEITKTYEGNRVAKDGWEDEEFFISRVKLRPLITNTATQIFPEYTGNNDKKLLFWVPCGVSNGYFQTGTLPNGVFDSEVFSSWSYVTHYGNWTSPYGWVPGGFADAAHKHGVLVSGVASVPNASLTGNWQECIGAMGNLTDDEVAKLGDFLRYHGVDGLGYNSEWNSSASYVTNLSAMHGKLVKHMKQYQDNFENPWYAGTGDSGSSPFYECLSSNLYGVFGTSEEPRTIMFLNYNWNTVANINTDKTGIATTGRSPQDLYLGQNMQGGQSSDRGAGYQNEWLTHSEVPYSIGLWGAHSNNMLFPTRVTNGGSDILKQQGYQKVLEQWFTNGKRNPAAKMDITTSKALSPNDNFQGMSRHMSARSAYGWELSDEPFITYFSLGNGNCYRMNGDVAYDNEWYNIGMQDYTPTWRWWWADELLGTGESVPENSMNAEYCWDDAWNGGSSLKISGSTTAGQTQYLHLFKTNFNVKNNDIITIRYKILKGNGDINFVYSKVGSETTEVTPDRTSIHKTSDKFFYDDWNVTELKVAARGSSALSQGLWAMLGLKFTNAQDLEVLIGEMSIKRGTYNTPDMPVVRRGKVLSNVVSGFDAKLYWSMPNTAAAGTPVYNSDVKVSHFELWAQVQGEEPQFMGTTTSWAGLMFKIKNPNHSNRVRLGVQAVSLDHKTKSGISWTSEYLTAPAHEVSEEVAIDKACIKPGEEFRIWFVDEMHENATLTLYNNLGTKVASNNGASRELVTSLNEIGAYDLVANEGTDKEIRYSCYAQISDFSVGRLPEIQELTIDGETAKEGVTFGVGQGFKAGYKGREADGQGSRAMKLDYKFFGGPIDDMEIGTGSCKSFSVSYWVRPTSFPVASDEESVNFFGIEDRTGSWPRNNWGYVWSFLDPAGSGHITHIVKRGNSSNSKEYAYFYPETTKLSVGAWTHVTLVFDYDSSRALLMKLYLNGVYQVPTKSGMGKDVASEENVIDGIPVRGPNREGLTSGEWMHILGGRGSNPGYPDALIDDVVIWDGVASDDDIAKAMTGLDANNLPSNVKCFWDFEGETVDGVSESRLVSGATTPTTVVHNGRFMSKGQVTDAPFGTFQIATGESEGASVPCHITPIYEAGCPYVKGSGFKVETKPSWSTKQATISNANGSDTEGEAQVEYGKDGDKILTLTLENSWGKDVQEYPAFNVSSAIDGVAADEADGMNAYTVNKTLFLEFAEGGAYEVSVYNMSGMLVGRDARSINAGEMMHITIGQAGVYVVSVVKDGKELRNIKIVNK